jgi:hypothetical protein
MSDEQKTDYRLIEVLSDNKYNFYDLLYYPAVLGRSENCDIRISNNIVSARHAEITMEQGIVKIRDLGSTNGTYTAKEQGDKKQIDNSWSELNHNNWIYLGNPEGGTTVTLIFQIDDITIPQTPGSGHTPNAMVNVNMKTRTVKLNGKIIEGFSPKALDILNLLWEKTGAYVTNAEISQAGWPERVDALKKRGISVGSKLKVCEDTDIRQQISSIRKIIGADLIENSQVHGYMLISS